MSPPPTILEDARQYLFRYGVNTDMTVDPVDLIRDLADECERLADLVEECADERERLASNKAKER